MMSANMRKSIQTAGIWQIWKGRLKLGKRYALFFDLESENFPKTKLKGLRLIVHFGVRDDGYGYTLKRYWHIPLSWSDLKIWRRMNDVYRQV